MTPDGPSVPGEIGTAGSPKGIEADMSGSVNRANALDHVVVVLFENRSFDNVLGHLYGPGDGKTFEASSGRT